MILNHFMKGREGAPILAQPSPCITHIIFHLQGVLQFRVLGQNEEPREGEERSRRWPGTAITEYSVP